MTLPRAFYEVPLAHRALHDVARGRPENSRAAIRAAIAAGYGIEIDVQLSADGAAMVFHDYALDRLTHNSGAVRLRSADELKAVPLKGGGEGIPDLPEVLRLVAGQVPLLIELKDQDGAMGDEFGSAGASYGCCAYRLRGSGCGDVIQSPFRGDDARPVAGRAARDCDQRLSL